MKLADVYLNEVGNKDWISPGSPCSSATSSSSHSQSSSVLTDGSPTSLNPEEQKIEEMADRSAFLCSVANDAMRIIQSNLIGLTGSSGSRFPAGTALVANSPVGRGGGSLVGETDYSLEVEMATCNAHKRFLKVTDVSVEALSCCILNCRQEVSILCVY